MNAVAKILVVDDEDALRWNMRAFLEDLGFDVIEADRGRLALETCSTEMPDLVLLDISMPEMDGYEVCRRLKADPRLAEAPVIFLSAFLRTEDKIKAFSSGAVDYVTKPFQFEEVEARIRVQLELLTQRRQLKAQHEALVSLERQRDAFTHMMAHDMRSPLGSALGSLELAQEFLEADLGAARTQLLRAEGSIRKIADMLNEMLELSRLESGSMPLDLVLCDLAQVARQVLEGFESRRGGRHFLVCAPEALYLECDAGLVERVLSNLVANALKFTEDTGRIEIRAEKGADCIQVFVSDDGPGIPPALQGEIFEKFSQASSELKAKGFGLGLAFCRLAVEAHHGSIGVQSQPGSGSTFWFKLPSLIATEE